MVEEPTLELRLESFVAAVGQDWAEYGSSISIASTVLVLVLVLTYLYKYRQKACYFDETKARLLCSTEVRNEAVEMASS